MLLSPDNTGRIYWYMVKIFIVDIKNLYILKNKRKNIYIPEFFFCIYVELCLVYIFSNLMTLLHTYVEKICKYDIKRYCHVIQLVIRFISFLSVFFSLQNFWFLLRKKTLKFGSFQWYFSGFSLREVYQLFGTLCHNIDYTIEGSYRPALTIHFLNSIQDPFQVSTIATTSGRTFPSSVPFSF